MMKLKFLSKKSCSQLCINSVQAPCRITTLKPVVVYLHIGGFSMGSGSFFGSADYLIHHDIVYVTLNYRLHVFGEQIFNHVLLEFSKWNKRVVLNSFIEVLLDTQYFLVSCLMYLWTCRVSW